MRYFIGVDVGAKGAIAVIDENSEIVYLEMLTRQSLIECANKFCNENVVACVEKVNAMPGQGVTSMFTFGKNAGFIEGVFEMAEIPYQLVPPNNWKKAFSLTKQDKAASIRVCKGLFPKANLLPTPRCKKESDGLSEALLMALYAKRNL